jgi:hypothetical protein
MGKKIKIKNYNDWNFTPEEQKASMNKPFSSGKHNKKDKRDVFKPNHNRENSFNPNYDKRDAFKPKADEQPAMPEYGSIESELIGFLDSGLNVAEESVDTGVVSDPIIVDNINDSHDEVHDNENDTSEDNCDQTQMKAQVSSIYGISGTEVNEEILNSLSLKFDYNSDLDKLIIDDGVAPKTFAVDKAIYDDNDMYSEFNFEDETEFDSDFFVNTTILLYAYIITCMHPCVVIPNSIFDKEFANVKSFDTSKFTFVTISNFVLVYVVDTKESNTLFSITPEYEANKTEHMNFWISLAYWCGTINNAFYIDDKEYIIGLMNSLEKTNNYARFKHLFFSDPMTTVEAGADMIYTLSEDAEYVQYKAREFLKLAAGYNDDDDADDEDMDDTPISIMDIPDRGRSIDDENDTPVIITEEKWKAAYAELLNKSSNTEVSDEKKDVKPEPINTPKPEPVKVDTIVMPENTEMIEVPDTDDDSDDDDSMVVPIMN